MRLDRLSITAYKNLQNFSIDFDSDSFTTVLVGRNGTGKSNLLEALVLIFQELDLGSIPSFAYEIQYFCRGSLVHVTADPGRKVRRVEVTVDGRTIPFSQFCSRRELDLLPSHVFGYYSGLSERMSALFDKHQNRFYTKLKDNSDVSLLLRRLFYARLEHSHFVLLAFFGAQDSETKHFLQDFLRISSFDSALFALQQPPWVSREGDPRFWNARGIVAQLLSRLYQAALAPMRTEERIKLDFRKAKTSEHLYLYLPDQAAVQDVVSQYSSQQEFFKALESTYIADMLRYVRIRLKTLDSSGMVTYRDLSEGEQQLLMVLGLLRFTKQEEALFLLDEPDTHLNPAWCLQYVDLLRQVIGPNEQSHVIMTTHNPAIVVGLERSQLQILERTGDRGTIAAYQPRNDPKAIGIAALLTSDVYGLRSQLDSQMLRQLDRKRELDRKDALTDVERHELESLRRSLDAYDLDSAASVRDPLYEPFVRAMAQQEEEEGLSKIALTRDEQSKRLELATQIVREIRKAENISE